jgi:ferredoxin
VRIDEARCTACGTCEDVCPQVFRVPDKQVAEVHAQPGDDCARCVLEAAGGCPQGAIQVLPDPPEPG